MFKRSGYLLTVLVAVITAVPGRASAQAVSCEELRAKVEAKIRGNGVTVFAVEIIESTSKPQGQVVGTCERGTRQLVYSPGSSKNGFAIRARPCGGSSERSFRFQEQERRSHHGVCGRPCHHHR